MKLLEIGTIMGIKEHWRVGSINLKRTGPGVSVNE